MINALEKLFGRFSFIPYRRAKAAQVDPEIFSHLELHITAHPDIETSCVLANLFRTIYMDSSLFYVESLERLDATSRSLARDLMRAKLLKAFPQEEWDEAHRLISQLPSERGGIGPREFSAAAATSAFAEKSGAPSPAIGSLAWAKAWVEYFKWLTRRRAAIAFAFGSQHGGFDGFKYLWGAPAAAAVIAAFFGVVLLDERLGFKRIILNSPPGQWIAEVIGADVDGAEVDGDAGKIVLAKARPNILRLFGAQPGTLPAAGPGTTETAGQAAAQESGKETVAEEIVSQEPQQGSSGRPAPEETTVLAFAAPDSAKGLSKPTAPSPVAGKPALSERPPVIPPIVRKPQRPELPPIVPPIAGQPAIPENRPVVPPVAGKPLPALPPIVTNPVDPSNAAIPDQISDLAGEAVETVKEMTRDVAENTPVERQVSELVDSAPTTEVVTLPAATPDFISRLQGGGTFGERATRAEVAQRPASGAPPVERAVRPVVNAAAVVDRPAAQRIETGVSTIDRPLSRVETAVTRIERPVTDAVTRIERPVVQRIERPVIDNVTRIERPVVERVVVERVEPVVRPILPDLNNLLR